MLKIILLMVFLFVFCPCFFALFLRVQTLFPDWGFFMRNLFSLQEESHGQLSCYPDVFKLSLC